MVNQNFFFMLKRAIRLLNNLGALVSIHNMNAETDFNIVAVNFIFSSRDAQVIEWTEVFLENLIASN